MGNRLRKFALWVVMMSLSIVMGIGLCEGIVRVWGIMETLPESITLQQDNTLDWLGGTPVFNSQGLRDREYTEVKPQDTFRILLLGDSITYGVSTPWEQTYAEQLERLLNTRRSGHFEVINAGVPGWNTVFEEAYLNARGLAYQPDLIIIGFCLNDVEPMRPPAGFFTQDLLNPTLKADAPVSASAWASPMMAWGQTRQPERVRFSTRIKAFLTHYSHLYRLIRWRFDVMRRGFEADADYPFPFYRTESQSWQDCERALDNMAGMAEAHHSRAMLVVFPFFFKLKTLSWMDEAYPWKSLHEQIGSVARRFNMDVVDLLPCFEGYDPRDISVDPYHPDPQGHLMAAEAIYTALVAQRIAP